MNDITYIFGAGASFNSMPLVENFKNRFSVFINFIRSSDYQSDLFSDSLSFHSQIKAHASFDTYFKKLFHQQKVKQIIKSKKILLSFFLFEQLIDIETYDKALYEFQESDVKKEFNVDPRYEALIAGLLKPVPKIEFYTNVNFLTWNYDVNLLIGLRNFISPREKFEDFIEASYRESYFKVSPQVKVVHLNGYAFHPVLNNIFAPEEVIKKSIKQICNDYKSSESFESWAEQIRFAWEENSQDFDVLNEMIANSSTIILVGYSLPLYNRTFDTKILNYEALADKQLIVQDIRAKNIGSVLASDFDIDSRTEEFDITLHENCNSFIVPRQIFA